MKKTKAKNEANTLYCVCVSRNNVVLNCPYSNSLAKNYAILTHLSWD